MTIRVCETCWRATDSNAPPSPCKNLLCPNRERMNPLVLIGLAPLSWRFGTVRHKPGKWVFALGPFRLSCHNLKDS